MTQLQQEVCDEENNVEPEDSPSRGLHLARAFYNSCLDKASVEARGFEPMQQSLKQLFGGWTLLPNGSSAALIVGQFNLSDLYLPLFRLFGTTPICQIGVGNNQYNTSEFVIDLVAAYQKFMKEYSQMLGVSQEYLTTLDTIYHFERNIASHNAERDEQNPENEYEVTTLTELQNACPVIRWKSLLNELFKPLQTVISDSQSVAISGKKFLLARCELFTNYTKDDQGIRTLHNSAVWFFLWRTVTQMPSIVQRKLDEFKQISLGDIVDPLRWQFCATEVDQHFDSVLSRFFVRDRFNEEIRKDVNKIVENVQTEFKKMLNSSAWMKNEDKVKSLQKIEKMNISIGYPPDLLNITKENETFSHLKEFNVTTYFENKLNCLESERINEFRQLIMKDQTKWHMSPMAVNALYDETRNTIIIPAGILQRPFYDGNYSVAVNYGGIGVIVGHEITHALDYQGFHYSYVLRAVNGKLTLCENIADNGGLEAAFQVGTLCLLE
ncbi:unnamed protein product [Echinostoma caproni]|uniref:Neprilysin n=1 Tax=Echinostoma caproni TaxID=27848 RepID=A0A183A998_9TREM|nr:unnamed protein product [Echinostoma caproni]